ncbi:unnamed protein product [Dovyalis caffra]|uniref:Ribosomal protein L11 n=1 Tax=Dovyalis caffra TaxID=77055 RepID=A0AAV1SU42_9ROSI|nr:unnamed protein product [Dovyalis caffra]
MPAERAPVKRYLLPRKKITNSLSPCDVVVCTLLKFDKEQTEQIPCDKYSKNVQSKPFLWKGSGIGPASGVTIAKLKATVASETLKNEEFEESLRQMTQLMKQIKKKTRRLKQQRLN